MANKDCTVVATFGRVADAEQAVSQLRDSGFRENEISIVAKDDKKGRDSDAPGYDARTSGARGGNTMSGQAGGSTVNRRSGDAMTNQNISDGTGTGAAVGAGAGLLASAGALAIPGIGPILAAGPIAATLSGAVTGGLAGGLLDFGIPEQQGKAVEQEVRSGKAVALIETDSNGADKAREIFNNAGANKVEVHRRTS